MYAIKRKVGVSQTGQDGRMRLISALDFMQDCSWEWLEAEQGFTRFLEDNKLAMVLVSRQVDILRLPVFGEELVAQTSIFKCKGFSGYRNTAIYGGDGKPCLLSWSMGAFLNLETGRIGKLPDEEAAKICMDEKIEMEYLDRRIVRPDGGYRASTIPIRKNDIDLNNHVNNVRYVEAALELLPEDVAIERLRMEYKMPAKLGAVFYPYVVEGDHQQMVFLEDDSGNTYTGIDITLNNPLS